jgi:transposase-like protein
MAQLNITLNQEEILQMLSQNSGDAFRKLLETSLNSVLQAESAEQLQAVPYERSEERTDSRNGNRDRDLTTRIGRITLHVPRHRNQPFKTMVFENYSRSEAALIAGMTEMVIHGVSTRKVSQVVETLCGTSYSKSTVSELCKDLDKSVEEFRNRPLLGAYPFLTLDATYFKVRENHRIVSKALMLGYATNEKGIREVVGFGVYPNESKDTWNEFVESLKKRGLSGLLMNYIRCTRRDSGCHPQAFSRGAVAALPVPLFQEYRGQSTKKIEASVECVGKNLPSRKPRLDS